MAKYAIGVITLLATVLVALVAISGQEDRRILSYKLECNHFQGERSKSICRQFEREMEWTWFGHAILSLVGALHGRRFDASGATLVSLTMMFPHSRTWRNHPIGV